MDLRSQKQLNVSPKLKELHRRGWLKECWDWEVWEGIQYID